MALYTIKQPCCMHLLNEHQNGLYWDICNATTSKKLQVDGPRNRIPGLF
jgi:hypothetical protein